MQCKTSELRTDNEKATYLTIKPLFSSSHKPTAGIFSFAWVGALGDGRHLRPSHPQCDSQHSSQICGAGAEADATAHSPPRLQGCPEEPELR